MIELSVIICTRDPNRGRLQRTLAGLVNQSLGPDSWELLLIDNGSTPPLASTDYPATSRNLRIVQEPRPGLTPARLRGIAEAQGAVLVFVDDDNVLCPDYLSAARSHFKSDDSLHAAGGPIEPEFEVSPMPWMHEFFGLLAVRKFGDKILHAEGGSDAPWPDFAPVGAGLCIRREDALAYAAAVQNDPRRSSLDRRAGQLTSGGDNDMVFTALRAGGRVGYFPALKLTHLIPAARLDPDYLARLNQAIQRSWIRVLALHGASSWGPIPRWTVPLRMIRAWFTYRAWTSLAARIRWKGACGHFQGRADIA